MQCRYHADGSFSGARPASTPGLGFSLTLGPEETDMRFIKEEEHFKTREQALAEIASVGWHGFERTFSAEDELHWHDFDAVAYVLQGTASAEYEDGTVEHASAGCRIAAPAGIVHRNVGADWHGIIAFPVHPSQLTQPVNKPLASQP
jgi:quercetin dioxygenase-like cupin family protein